VVKSFKRFSAHRKPLKDEKGLFILSENSIHQLNLNSINPVEVEETAREIVDAAFKVHSELGPGLLESVYEECLCWVLNEKKIPVKRQFEVPIVFSGQLLNTKLRIDLFVNQSIVVELKAVEKILPLHQAQLMTYMKLTKTRLGFLINFNVPKIKEGMKRVVL
jgi:GxxExxY protein